VTINGEMLADVSGDEVEQYLLENNLVQQVDDTADAPTDSGCLDH
jgi:monothiol glutaredoxin